MKIISDEKLTSVLDFVTKFADENGYPPSVREICQGTGIKSTATVYSYLEKLKDRGSIVKSPSKNRAIGVSKKSTDNVRFAPLLGEVAAGVPILAQQNIEEYYPLPPEFSTIDDAYLLRVRGDSMIEIGIYSGDAVIVKPQKTAYNGELIVAMVEDSATVKRFYAENGRYRLHPENAEYEDMFFDNVEILGKVVGLIRKF